MVESLLVLSFLVIGVVLRKWAAFPIERLVKGVNTYLFYLVLPAIAFLYIPSMTLSWNLLIPVSAVWFTFLLSWLLFGLAGKLLKWDTPTTGCLVIVAGLANTSFMGFPVIESLYGKEGLPIALLMDQGGSFLLVSSLAVGIASLYSSKQGSLSQIPWKIISFPPFIFLVVSLLMSLLEIQVPLFSIPLLQGIAQTMVPVAILAIGLRLSLEKRLLASRFFWMGLGYRLLLAPLLVFLIYRNWLIPGELPFKVMVLESGMAPMITGALVAIQFDLNPRLASLLSGFGMLISLLTIGCWYFILG